MKQKQNLGTNTIALFGFLIFATTVQGADKSDRSRKDHAIMINGVGAHSCGVYIENRKRISNEMMTYLYQQWGAGFLAGASNQGAEANPVADLETYTAWLDKWCADDPSSKVSAGIIALGNKLSAKQ